MTSIAQRHVLIMATSGFEESELFAPREILLAAGMRVSLASPSLDPIRATVRDVPGRTISPDLTIAAAQVADYDALLLPGGVINPDALRADATAVALIKAFAAAHKPVGAICHAPWLLVEADLLRGVRATGWRSILTDLRYAGAELVEAAVVRDGLIVTARGPDDVADFTAALIAAIVAA